MTQTQGKGRLRKALDLLPSLVLLGAVSSFMVYGIGKSIVNGVRLKEENTRREEAQRISAKFERKIGSATLLDDDRDGSWDRLYVNLGLPGSPRELYVKEGYSTGISQSFPSNEPTNVHIASPDYFCQFDQQYPQDR